MSQRRGWGDDMVLLAPSEQRPETLLNTLQ
jgi:hypothetical protein